MEKDLLLQLFEIYISKKNVPDQISIEFDSENKPLIQFEWKKGMVKTFGYTLDRYNEVSEAFKNYWNFF